MTARNGGQHLDAAGAWFARRQGAAPRPETEIAFQAWLAADPAHAEAYAAVEAVWRDLVPPAPRRGRRATVAMGVAGGLALAGGGAWLGGGPQPLARLAADHATRSGSQGEAVLADGVRIWLDAATALDEGPGPRQASLLAGQALFDVPAREKPFTVTAGPGRVTMREGRLLVKRLRAGGRAIALAGAARIEVPGRARLALSAGQGAAFDADDIEPPVMWEAGEALAWRGFRLLYRDASLAEVLDDLGRQNGLHAVVSAAVARLDVTAALDARDLNGALATLARSLSVRLTRLPGVILAQAG